MSSPFTCALLVPCKNGARFLPRLFASARAQTRSFDEVWLFDDGSDDQSSTVARGLGAHVLRVEESLGPSAARNRLVAACGCSWLHFHDADDVMHPHYLERVMARAQPGVDVVICDMRWVMEETEVVDNIWRYDEAEFHRQAQAYLVRNTVGGINGLYRRTAFQSVNGFDEGLGYWEDMDLNLRLCQAGAQVAVVNEQLVTAYRRQTSYSNSNLPKVWRVKLEILARLLEHADSILRETVALEAEEIANRFALLRCTADVPSALALAERAGGDPPTTRNPALRALKHVVPRAWAFHLQFMLRQRFQR